MLFVFVLFCFIYLFFNQMHTNVIYERTPRHETSTVQSQQAFVFFCRRDRLLFGSEKKCFVSVFREWGFVYVHSIDGRNDTIAHQRSKNKNLASVFLSGLLLQQQQRKYLFFCGRRDYNAQVWKTVFACVQFLITPDLI